MLRIIMTSIIILATAGLAACVAPYKPPKEGEPFALVKMKFAYSTIMRNTSIGSRLQVRQGDGKSNPGKYRPAHNKTHGSSDRTPRIPIEAIKIHPDKETDVRMAVYFFWYTTETRMVMVGKVMQPQTTQVYHERSCTAQITFNPKADHIYLLDYSAADVTRNCTTRAYEQTETRGGKFRLRNVGHKTPDRDKKNKG